MVEASQPDDSFLDSTFFSVNAFSLDIFFSESPEEQATSVSKASVAVPNRASFFVKCLLTLLSWLVHVYVMVILQSFPLKD